MKCSSALCPMIAEPWCCRRAGLRAGHGAEGAPGVGSAGTGAGAGKGGLAPGPRCEPGPSQGPPAQTPAGPGDGDGEQAGRGAVGTLGDGHASPVRRGRC